MKIAEISANWVGRRIDGSFPLHRTLGSGDGSVVFLTTHEGRNAAIKIVLAQAETQETQLARWREAAKLSHPNVIKILATGCGELDDVPVLYLVMERAEEDLSQVLPDRSLTAVEAREMLGPALEALGYIHGKGLVHGHVKPSNIMAVEDRLKISSDGVGRGGEAAKGAYAPPEGVASPAGDVWSLGITLVEVLTQRRPSNGIVPADLPEPFLEIARGGLAKNAGERLTIPQISKLFTPPASVAIVPRRSYLPVGALILLGLVVVTVIGVMIMHSQTGMPEPVKPAEVANTPQPQAPPPQTASRPTPLAIPQKKQEPRQEAKAVTVPEPKEKPDREPAAEPTGNVPVSGIVAQPMPEIPDKARSTIHGKVKFTVRVDVAPSGAVTDAKLDSSGGSKYFSDRALAAVRQWKFEPVAVNGSEVGQRWRVRFEFVRNGTKVQPQRVSP